MTAHHYIHAFILAFLMAIAFNSMAESIELSNEIERCAPSVDPETMNALVSTESRKHQYALADAGPLNLPWTKRKHLVKSYYFETEDEAVAKAQSLIEAGHTVSLGLTQINDRNLPALGLSIREVFDVCTNLSSGARILTHYYGQAVGKFGAGQRALRAALSKYNSGDWIRGEKDGYVDLIYSYQDSPKTPPRKSPAVGEKTSSPRRDEFTLSVSNY